MSYDVNITLSLLLLQAYIYLFLTFIFIMVKIKILSYRLPGNSPSAQVDCGWIAYNGEKEIGWVSMIFYPKKLIKFADAYVISEYRGKGVYSQLWNTRFDYCKKHFPNYKIISYCKESVVDFYIDKGFKAGEKVTLMTLESE